MLKKLDIYIIKKFLSSFILAITLILMITIVFDVSEKIKQFISANPPISEIVEYYLTFLPFFANMFSPLFAFISVVYFTSRMAGNTEIVAILNSGISYNRLLVPYFITAVIIALMSFYLANFLIPKTNIIKNDFTEKYLQSRRHHNAHDIHKQNDDNELVYVDRFDYEDKEGRYFTLERFNDEGQLLYKLTADKIAYDTITEEWIVTKYSERTLKQDGSDNLNKGDTIRMKLNLTPIDFSTLILSMDEMGYKQIRKHIEKQKKKGESVTFYEIEKHKRIAIPVSTIILSLMGVSLTSRKRRGGTGINLAIGITLAFGYIVLSQISTVFAQYGNLSPVIAVWIPNVIFLIVAIFTVRFAQK